MIYRIKYRNPAQYLDPTVMLDRSAIALVGIPVEDDSQDGDTPAAQLRE